MTNYPAPAATAMVAGPETGAAISRADNHADAPIRRPTRCDVLRPSELAADDVALWRTMIAQSPCMQRAFFTPEFAVACQRAGCRAYVAILSDGLGVCGFLPFQFKNAWSEMLRLAERIGGNLSQGASLIAWPMVKVSSERLLRLSRLAAMHVTQLIEGQDQFGLDAIWSQICYVTDLRAGPAEYFSALLARNRGLVRDTERQQRRAEKTYGPLSLETTSPVSAKALGDMIAAKRHQYQRTQVTDPFDRPETLQIIEALNESRTEDCKMVLARLDAGERVLAQHLGLQHKGALSWWFPVYDPDVQGVSPGRLLLWDVIRRAADHGITEIDYGEGHAQYKQQFSTGSVKMGRALWSAGNVRGLTARGWLSIEWRLDRWRREAKRAGD